MKPLVCALLGLSLIGCKPQKKHTLTMDEMIAADPLPLGKGATWQYDVTVKRYDPDTDKETTKTMTWTTQVIDARESNGVTAYRIKGWPDDLAALESGESPQASEMTILRSGNNFLFGKTAEPSLDGAEGWWQAAANEVGYTLTLYTGPDDKSFDLEPNTGVARYHYAHHGTTNEVEAKLTSFTKGSALTQPNPPR
jgi:hypothetical protein